jgi:hypothetical protein
MTAFILYRENIRKFVEELTRGGIDPWSASGDRASIESAPERYGNGIPRPVFLCFPCDPRKGVNRLPAVPKQGAGNYEN